MTIIIIIPTFFHNNRTDNEEYVQGRFVNIFMISRLIQDDTEIIPYHS